MKKIQLLKEPGYIYDLNFIFCLRFNFDFYVNQLPDDEKKAERIIFFKNVLKQFGDISDDLYVFFHTIETGKAFLPTCYFTPYHKQFSSKYNFDFFSNLLQDKDSVVRSLIKFYFYDLNDEVINNCQASYVQLFSHIKNSKYSDAEKSKLYEFFINPTPYINKLQAELLSKEIFLSQYYKNNYEKIIDAFNQISYELLNEQLKDFRKLDFLEKENEEIYISYCLLNKYCFYFCYLDNGFMHILGYDYLSLLDFIKKERKAPSLNSLGNALCEESRVKILNFLLEHEEVTCKDLEKEFSFSGSTAYHHITIMVKAGVVKTRNEGKTILYSLSKNYFDAIIGVLSKYSNVSKGKIL